MMRLLLLVFFCFPLFCIAQAIDNAPAYKHIAADGYFRFNYDNDYFSAQDRYYTQGLHGEVVKAELKHFFLSRTLLGLKDRHSRYGIAVEHNAYTPTNLESDTIRYGDRPYAAALMFQSFRYSIDERGQRLSASLSLGVIGPWAGGKEMQTSIHEQTGNIIPQGWQYQVANDLVLNYQLNYEHRLLAWRNYLLLAADAMARIGTLSDKASVGATLMAGYFNDPFSTTSSKAGLRLYVYDRAGINAIGYDATLQGGLFYSNSPYTIPAPDISRLTFQNRFGISVSWRSVYLEYFQNFLTKEFSSGEANYWGGVQLGIVF